MSFRSSVDCHSFSSESVKKCYCAAMYLPFEDDISYIYYPRDDTVIWRIYLVSDSHPVPWLLDSLAVSRSGIGNAPCTLSCVFQPRRYHDFLRSRKPFERHHFIITVTSQWASWRLKSATSRLFVPWFVQAPIKENIKAPHHTPLWGESNSYRWIPLTKDHLRAKCFYLPTLSCHYMSYEIIATRLRRICIQFYSQYSTRTSKESPYITD